MGLCGRCPGGLVATKVPIGVSAILASQPREGFGTGDGARLLLSPSPSLSHFELTLVGHPRVPFFGPYA